MKNMIIAMTFILGSFSAHAGDNGQNGRLTDKGSLLLVQELKDKKIDRAILCYFDDAEVGGPKTWSLGLTQDETLNNLVMPDGSAYHTANPVCIDHVTSVVVGEDSSLRSVSF